MKAVFANIEFETPHSYAVTNGGVFFYIPKAAVNKIYVQFADGAVLNHVFILKDYRSIYLNAKMKLIDTDGPIFNTMATVGVWLTLKTFYGNREQLAFRIENARSKRKISNPV